MKNATSAVTIGTTIPPARCQTSSREATVVGGACPSSSGCGPCCGASGSLKRPAPPCAAAEHLEADLLFGRGARVLADDPALVDDEDPVGERQDLVQLERDEQDRATLVALLDEPPVEVLDRAHVEAARRLRRHEHARVARDLARGDDLLLVAARERAADRPRPAAAHVELPIRLAARSISRRGKSQPHREAGGRL